MKAAIQNLLSKKIYLGTSSWKYAGWKGLVYEKKYQSEKEFNEKCLTEYADHYPAVGIDHTYYAWPTEKVLLKYKTQTPDYFRFGLKVTEKVTVFRYPNLKRYGKDAGTLNESFLNADIFLQEFVGPLQVLENKVGPVILEFSQFYPGMLASGAEFVKRLDQFFGRVSKHSNLKLAVEMRNSAWLKPEYFEMLCSHGVAHVFNSWTRMPELKDQLKLTEKHKLPYFVSRVLLQPGTKYEEAVEAFSPYDKIVEKQAALREGAAALIERAIEAGVPAYVFVNNRAEGCAPQTIDGIVALVKSGETK